MQKIIQLPLQQIQSNFEREDFAEEWLEEIAQTLLDTGTLLNPLIVEPVDTDKYMVLTKDLAFFAALKASEMDERFTQVSAYVIESEEQLDAVEAQLQALTDSDESQDILGMLEAILEQLKQPADKADIEALKSEFSVHIFSLMQAIEQNGGQFNSLFEVLGEIDHQVEQTLAKVSVLADSEATPATVNPIAVNPITDFIHAVNTLPSEALERKLKVAGANKVLIDNLVAVREVEHFVPFTTLDELLEVKGVGDKSLLKIISHWNA